MDFETFCVRKGLDPAHQGSRQAYDMIYGECEANQGDSDRIVVMSKNGWPLLVSLRVAVGLGVKGLERTPFSSTVELLRAYWSTRLPNEEDITVTECVDEHGFLSIEARSPTGHCCRGESAELMGETPELRAAAMRRWMLQSIALDASA